MRKLKGLLFDLDGVLCETSKYHFLSWNEIAKKFNKTLPDHVEDQVRGIPRMASLEVVLNAIGETNLSVAQKEALAKEKNDIYKKFISSMSQKDLYPGALNLLQEAKKHNLKIALASSSKNGPDLLRYLDITRYFDYVSNPAHIKNAKPAPDIFLDCAKGLKLNSDEVLGLEDAAAGIEAINSGNIYSVGIGRDDIIKDADLKFCCIKQITVAKLIENFEK